MSTGPSTAPDADLALSRMLSTLLRAGVWVSGTVAALGGVSYLWTHAHDHPDYASFKGDPSGLTSLRAIATGVAAAQPAAFMQLAVIVLVATPIVCVATAAAPEIFCVPFVNISP